MHFDHGAAPDLPFASEIEGKMHACGHDAHTAMLLGAARVLAGMRSDLHGTAVLVFPTCRRRPGGAEPMIEQGALDDPKVEAIAMLHVDARLVRARSESVPAGECRIATTVPYRARKSGHGAYPHTP